MSSWLNLGLPVATYVGGVLTKPLQAAVEEWRERRKLRNALYAELGHNLDVVATRMNVFLNTSRENKLTLFVGFAQDSFNHALANPPRFHQLRESKQLRIFYETLGAMKQDVSVVETVGSLGFLIRIVGDGMQTGALNRRLLQKYVSPGTLEMVEFRMTGTFPRA